MQQIMWFPWTLWCGLVFGIVLIVAFPVLFFVVISKNEKWIHDLHYLPPIASRIVLFLWGIRIKIKNREFIEGEKQLIYISNHTSYLDGIIASAIIPNFLKFLGKAELLNWPVLGFLIKHLYVPVWRDDKEQRARSMVQMHEKLKTGASFFLCPEGTCNTTPELLTHFQGGAFRLAIDNRLPLVPLTIIGTRYLFPRKGLMIKPGKVIVYWHAGLNSYELDSNDVDALKFQALDTIRQDLLRHYPSGVYPA